MTRRVSGGKARTLATITLAGYLLAAGRVHAQAAPAKATPAQAAPAQATPIASGLVRPGMSEAAVRAAWGEPSGTRAHGSFTYMFFANGCQPACGIQDVVILERGQVVDAIARSAAHRYDGVSSSPASRAPTPTPATPPGHD